MPTHVALLRGVNVGGHNRVAMAELRDVMASLGHTDVATYIQSGNVVFTSARDDADTEALAVALERAIAATLAVRPRVVILSRAELAQVVEDNPYPDETIPKCLHALFGRRVPGREEVEAVAAAVQRARDKGALDDACVVGRAVFLHTPDGLGRSLLATELARSGGVAAEPSSTIRNWATVTRLLSMCQQ